MSDPQDDPRPFFREVREQQHFDVVELAREARTHELTVLAMLRGHAVYRLQAEKVLRALSAPTGRNYTLETVRIPLHPEDGTAHE